MPIFQGQCRSVGARLAGREVAAGSVIQSMPVLATVHPTASVREEISSYTAAPQGVGSQWIHPACVAGAPCQPKAPALRLLHAATALAVLLIMIC